MPTYDFVCPGCGNSLERNVPVDRRGDAFPCTVCGGVLIRKFGVGGVVVR